MSILNTSSDNDLYESLDNILNVNSGDVKKFLYLNLSKFLNYHYWEIDLEAFYQEFSLPKDFILDEITIHHVTTRLEEVTKENFVINNLETVLLSDNALTEFMKKHGIEFKKEQGISVYYKGNLHQFKGYAQARLRNRLSNLRDSCVNGFLFAEKMESSYTGLTGMPEIFSDLMDSLDRTDLQYEYFDKMKCYMVTLKVSLEDFIFDDFSEKSDLPEKTKLILQYVINYLCYKISKAQYYCFDNPIIRLPDNKSVKSSDVFSIRQITDYKEIFEN